MHLQCFVKILLNVVVGLLQCTVSAHSDVLAFAGLKSPAPIQWQPIQCSSKNIKGGHITINSMIITLLIKYEWAFALQSIALFSPAHYGPV